LATSRPRPSLDATTPGATRLVKHEHELGSSTYATRAPDARLAPLMYRELLGFEQHRAEFSSWLEAPRPAMTLMVDLAGAIRADGEVLPDAWFGGLSDGYSVVEFAGTYASLDLELTPLGAYRVLGRPLDALRGEVVSLEALFGADGRVLADRLREAGGWDELFDLVERFLLGRVAEGPRPTPAVEWAYARVRASEGRVRVEALARELGCSRRYLSARFRAEVGLPPKTVARLIRFEHVCRRLRREPARWAEIAADAGFADQPHLNREFRELAGTTPSDFVARCILGGGVVGDAMGTAE
jgi:AraC-like DNA-binding protein